MIEVKPKLNEVKKHRTDFGFLDVSNIITFERIYYNDGTYSSGNASHYSRKLEYGENKIRVKGNEQSG